MAARVSDEQIADVETLFASDATFRRRFESDPVEALRLAGRTEAAESLASGLERLRGLGERISTDDAFRDRVTAEPLGTLTREGLDPAEIGAFLQSLDAPSDLLDKATVDVQAHGVKRPTPSARMILLLAASGALASQVGGTWSDARLKQHIEPVTDALARLRRL